jgi:hypothetical protein
VLNGLKLQIQRSCSVVVISVYFGKVLGISGLLLNTMRCNEEIEMSELPGPCHELKALLGCDLI